jgi:hypothetical protein
MKIRYADHLDITPLFISDDESFTVEIERAPSVNVVKFIADDGVYK